MSSKTVLQQLMGGTSDVKENFLPGMGDIYSNIKGGDEFGEGEGEGEGEGDNKKKEPVVKASKSATKQASKSATKPAVVKPAAAAPAVEQFIDVTQLIRDTCKGQQ
jgi:hypothetical protein